MFGDYEDALLESLIDEYDASVEESYIDPEDETSIMEAMADIEIAEACKKESCKKEICEKCGKPKDECTCK